MTIKRSILTTQEMIDRYGRINGDNDIIHYDHDYAVKRGFRGTLNHGMMTMGHIAELGARKFGKDWFTKGEIHVKWINPVCPGDVVNIQLAEDGTVECAVQTGPAAKATATLAEE